MKCDSCGCDMEKKIPVKIRSYGKEKRKNIGFIGSDVQFCRKCWEKVKEKIKETGTRKIHEKYGISYTRIHSINRRGHSYIRGGKELEDWEKLET